MKEWEKNSDAKEDRKKISRKMFGI